MWSNECPKCRSTDFHVVETRFGKNYKRRRRKCGACDFAVTTYEVSKESYDAAKRNARFIHELHGHFSMRDNKDPVVGLTCDSCRHMRLEGCTFEFPDAGGTFAEMCIHYNDFH